jgi:predicted RND superfamily exporter protein
VVKKGMDASLTARGGRAAADPAQLQRLEDLAVMAAYVVQSLPIALGLLFVVFGLIVKKFPIPITITSLVLFLLLVLGAAALDPTTLVQGLVLKIIFFVGIAKAIQAAFAYERDKREQASLQTEY